MNDICKVCHLPGGIIGHRNCSRVHCPFSEPNLILGKPLDDLIEKTKNARLPDDPVDRALMESDQRRSWTAGQIPHDEPEREIPPDVLADEVRRLRKALEIALAQAHANEARVEVQEKELQNATGLISRMTYLGRKHCPSLTVWEHGHEFLKLSGRLSPLRGSQDSGNQEFIREEFERFIIAQRNVRKSKDLTRDSIGRYSNHEVHGRWLDWLAAWTAGQCRIADRIQGN